MLKRHILIATVFTSLAMTGCAQKKEDKNPEITKATSTTTTTIAAPASTVTATASTASANSHTVTSSVTKTTTTSTTSATDKMAAIPEKQRY